ncbi:MAG TPA: hypothetical protein VE988_12590 [Gemmataceae bacterium]|nr:hypothetical protein [Gemmataceae bacterium]
MAPPSEAIITAPPPKIAPKQPVEEGLELVDEGVEVVPERPRLLRREDPDRFEEESFEQPIKRRRKKRRRKSFSMLGGMDVFLVALLGLIGFGLLLVTMTVVIPPLAVLPIGLGYLVAIGGYIWFLVLVFKINPVSGVLCLLCGIYSVYIVATNFDDVKWPFFFYLTGIALIVLGSLAGGPVYTDALLDQHPRR